MPGLDRKGPVGQGSQTGRKLGRCNPDNRIEQTERKEDSKVDKKSKLENIRNTEQFIGDGRGRGPRGGGRGPEGRGRGRGRGRRFRGGQQ